MKCVYKQCLEILQKLNVLIQLAKHASRMLGKTLARDTGIKWDIVISAPELASTQTAYAIAFSTTGGLFYGTVQNR